MNRYIIEDRLSEADRYIALGERQIAEQREYLAQLDQGGRTAATAEARKLLEALVSSQTLRLAYQGHLREELRRVLDANMEHNQVTPGSQPDKWCQQ